MNAPFIIFLLSILFASIAFLMRKRYVASSVIASAGALIIAVLVLLAPIDEPLNIAGLSIKVGGTWALLGRRFVLDNSTRPFIGYLYLIGAFIISASWIARVPEYFNAVTLLVLGVLGGSIIVDPFLYAAIFLELAAMGAVLLLVSREFPARLGSLRLLSLFTLAMIMILITGWILEAMGVTNATPELAQRASIILGFGFAILLAVPPFHIWMATAAHEAHPYVLGFVSLILQSAGLFFMLRFFETYPWLRENTAMFSAIRIAGMATLLFGGFMAISQITMRKYMIYTLLTDIGVMLIAMGLGTSEGFQIGLGLTAVRAVGVTVWCLGLAKFIPFEKEGPAYKGAAYRMPVVTLSLVVGMFSLGGFPILAGFPGRYALILQLLETDFLLALFIVGAIFLIMIRGMRWTGIFLTRNGDDSADLISVGERIYFYTGMLACITLGFLPQIIYPWVIAVTSGLTRLVH